MAKKQGKLVWGVTLLALGALWLLNRAGVFGTSRTAILFSAIGFLAGAALCYVGFLGNPERRFWMLIPAGFLGSIGVMIATVALRHGPHALLPLIFFAGPAAAFARIYTLDRRRSWALLCAWASAVIGFTAFFGESRILGGDLSAIVFLAGTGLVFVWHFLRTGKDWALIPGGILLTCSFLPLFDRLPIGDEFTGAFCCFGFAATFAAVYLFGRPGSSSWARYPAIALAAIGCLAFVVGFAHSLFIYVLPLALIGAGVYLIRNSLRAGDGGGGAAVTPPAP